MSDRLQTVLDYHEATVHHPRRYARSPGWLDWATQPDPFRRYAGAPLRPLPLPRAGAGNAITWDALRAGIAPAAPAPVDDASLGDFFYHSLALSAWKQVRGPGGEVASRWALRVNPSSGNLHPTEGWLIDAAGVHHYAPAAHALERRGSWADGAGFAAAALGLPAGSFLVALSSIPWREAWKYGERAFRYCQHDAGHALACLGLAAARLGWTARRLEGVGTGELAALLGLDTRDEHEFEHAEALLAVAPGPWPGGALHAKLPVPAHWHGVPNRLSEGHHPWPVIAAMAGAVEAAAEPAWRAPTCGPTQTPTHTPTCAGASAAAGTTSAAAGTPGAAAGTTSAAAGTTGAAAGPAPDRLLDAATLIRARRSAVAMDGVTTLAAPAFFRLLAALLPTTADPVTRATGPDTDVSLLLLVHRVEDLAPGLYLLCRAPAHEAELRRLLRADFAWERPAGCPDGLPLFRLGTGDLREAARQVSCGQDIAADGVFSAGLLARFAPVLRERGAAAWPRLFQQAGSLGQLLYLEAEAAGLRGTGIGCYFDDEVHRAIGLVDPDWRSLYHFTVGGPVDDPRLQSVPAYADRQPGPS